MRFLPLRQNEAMKTNAEAASIIRAIEWPTPEAPLAVPVAFAPVDVDGCKLVVGVDEENASGLVDNELAVLRLAVLRLVVLKGVTLAGKDEVELPPSLRYAGGGEAAEESTSSPLPHGIAWPVPG